MNFIGRVKTKWTHDAVRNDDHLMATERLACIELETGTHPDAAIIVLHGLGADGNDFVPVVEQLKLPESLSVRFIFPHAPVRRVTVNGGYPMRAWYDITDADLDRRADLTGVRESQAQVGAILQHEEARGIASTRIVLAGFSQGGAIALYAGLRYPNRLAGVIGLSTYLVAGDQLQAEGSPANRNLPIFMAHGTQDPIVRLERGEASRKTLEGAGHPVEWRTYPMGHSVVWEEIVDLANYLAIVIGGNQR